MAAGSKRFDKTPLLGEAFLISAMMRVRLALRPAVRVLWKSRKSVRSAALRSRASRCVARRGSAARLESTIRAKTSGIVRTMREFSWYHWRRDRSLRPRLGIGIPLRLRGFGRLHAHLRGSVQMLDLADPEVVALHEHGSLDAVAELERAEFLRILYREGHGHGIHVAYDLLMADGG